MWNIGGYSYRIILYQLFLHLRKWANKHELDFETVSLLRSLHLDDTAALSRMNQSQLAVSATVLICLLLLLFSINGLCLLVIGMYLLS